MKCYGMCCGLQKPIPQLHINRNISATPGGGTARPAPEVCVGVHAGDIFSGAQLVCMAAFTSNKMGGGCGSETRLSIPRSASSPSRGEIFAAPGSSSPTLARAARSVKPALARRQLFRSQQNISILVPPGPTGTPAGCVRSRGILVTPVPLVRSVSRFGQR